MERACPKRKKTKKIVSDNDVKKLLNNNESDGFEKIISHSRVPDDWPTGLYVCLYHEGYTLGLTEEIPCDIVRYAECDFLLDLEQGLIPDIVIPMLPDMEMIADGKLVAAILDYRGLPKPGSTNPKKLDFPIQKRHILSRSKESLVLELFDALGERATMEELHQLENCLLMLQSPALCLDTSDQVFEIRSNIHLNQNLLNSPLVRSLITRANGAEREPCTVLLELQQMIGKVKRETSVREEVTTIKKLRPPKESTAPATVLATVLELAEQRMKNMVSSMTQQTEPQSSQPPPHGPTGASAKEAAYHGGMSHMKQFKQSPMSPSLAPSPMAPVGQSPPTVTKISPKPAMGGPIRGAQPDGMVMAKPIRGRYAPPGYMVPAGTPPGMAPKPGQPMAVPRMPVQMMPAAALAANQQAMGAQGGIMGPRGVMHMATQPGIVMQSTGPSGPATLDPNLTKQMTSQGQPMMIAQQYGPRSQYQYQAVAQPGYVDHGQYLPQAQQQPRPLRQVLQIPLPANVNPHRQTLPPGGGGPMQRMPYNQMAGMNPRMYSNQYQHPQ